MPLFSTETQRRLTDVDRHWRVQLSFRAFATFLAFPALILFAAATSESKADYGGNDWVDAFPLAPILLALLYNPIHILLTTSPTLHRDIHPVIPLLLDLHIWALAVPALVFSVGDGWFWYWQPATFSIDGDIVLCSFEGNWFSEQCNPMIYTLGRVEIAANVFLALILIAHFTLFIYDCIATHRGRISRAPARRARRNIELQYHRDPAANQPTSVAAPAAATAPPAYTPSSTSHHHQPSSSISKSITSETHNNRASSTTSSNAAITAKDKNWEATTTHQQQQQQQQHTPPRGGGWERNEHGAPQLSSPVSPVNSGSGGGFGFMGDEGGAKGEGEGPFGDEAAVKYA